MSDQSLDPDRVLQRAHLPEVLFDEDVASCLDLTPDRAAAGIRAGLFGPSFFVDGRPAVLRSDFFETVRLRSAQGDRAAREVLRPRQGMEVSGGGHG